MAWCLVLFILSIVCVSVHSNTLMSKTNNVRKSRQLDFGECCPCPKSRDDRFDEPLHQVEVPTVDDCPCRNRETDSVGASSVLSPALQALRPFIRSDHSKGDPEPLLKPEVGLASSVLKTLQEVTNEEYEDALARDATRSVVKALETDFPLVQSNDTPGSIINIILNPKERGNDLEVEPEASHVQETRCVHPLGSTNNNYEPNNLKTVHFREQSNNQWSIGKKLNAKRNNFDMDNQASEIQNSLQKPTRSYIMKSLHEPNVISLELPTEDVTLANVSHDKLFTEHNPIGANKFAKVPDLKLSTIVENIKKSIQSNSVLNKLTKKQIITPDFEDKNTLMNTNSEGESKQFPVVLTTLRNVFDYVEKPTNLKNMLKLKDVEFIPKQVTVNDNKTKHKRLDEDTDIINASVSEDEKLGKHEKNEIVDTVPIAYDRAINVKVSTQEEISCHNISNIQEEPKDPLMRKETQNSMSESELIQNDSADEKYNPKTETSSFENIFEEQVTESSNNPEITKHGSEVFSEKEILALNDKPTFKRNKSLKEKQDKKILPLIRADIIKSFTKFKKVNDEMQENLRQNLQDALQAVHAGQERKIGNKNSVQNDVSFQSNENIKKSDSITENDLQRMSDSILNESNIKSKKLSPDSSFKHANAENELDDCVLSTDIKQGLIKENNLNESTRPPSTGYLSDTLNKPSKSINKGDIISKQVDEDEINNKNISILNYNSRSKNNSKSEYYTRDSITNESDNHNEGRKISSDKRSKDFSDFLVQMPRHDKTHNINTTDLKEQDNSALQKETETDNEDFKSEMSQKNEITNLSNPPTTERSEVTSHERQCLPNDSNDMNVQASEPLGNRVRFAKPELNILKLDRLLPPKASLKSGLKPYSARLTSPHSLDRDTIHPNLASKVNNLQGNLKNDDLNNIFKNIGTAALPSLGKNKHDTFISKPLDDIKSHTDYIKFQSDDSLNKLNDILRNGAGGIKSNNLYKNVLDNADDIRDSLSKAHNDLNSKLQQLQSDWSNKIHTIGRRVDNVDSIPFYRASNTRKDTLNSEKKIPLLNFEKPRTVSNIKQGTFIKDGKLKLPQLLPKSLFKAPSQSERKATILTTTKRPFPMFTTKRPPTKELSLKSVPKLTRSQTIKDALESGKSDKFNSKIKDLRTLSSNVNLRRVEDTAYDTRKSISESQESLENIKKVQPYKDIGYESSISDGSGRSGGLPFQLKAEEFSILNKLLDGIRISRLQSDMSEYNDDYRESANENLQAPSQKIENIHFPENTLKENVSYKCKMICTNDDK